METYTEDQLAAEFGVTPRQVKNYAATIAEIDGIAPTGRRRHSAAARQKMLQLRELGGPIAYKKWVQAQLPIAQPAPQPVAQPAAMAIAQPVTITPTVSRWQLASGGPTELALLDRPIALGAIAPLAAPQSQLLDLAMGARSSTAAARDLVGALRDRLLQGIDHVDRLESTARQDLERLEDEVTEVETLAAEYARAGIRANARLQAAAMTEGKLTARLETAASRLGYSQSQELQPV